MTVSRVSRRAFPLTLLALLLGAGGVRADNADGAELPTVETAAFSASTTHVELAPPADRTLSSTFYVAQMSSESGWEDVLVNPLGARYIGAYLAVATLAKPYAERFGGRMSIEWEGQAAYNFGKQEYWEFNAVPVLLRWHFAGLQTLDTTAAFGLGLSYTTELPRIEVELEGESSRALVYWVMEFTAGPPQGRWALSLRLHHRSVGYGLMGDEGGMNAVGMGMRWRF